MSLYFINTTTSIFILLLSVNVPAQEADVKLMMSDIAKKQSTPELKRQAITMGKDRAVLCNQCHGANGNSMKSGVPNLAEQNPVYLLEQIEKFADGRRKNRVMNVLSKNFTRDDKENLAIFYASLKVKASKSNAQLAAQGKPLYVKQCSSCHGDNGIGRADFARLAGQQSQYVENTLKRFRDNSKNQAKPSKRHSAIMEAIAKNLSNQDIKALSAYIAQLK